MKISKEELIKRIQAYRDTEEERVENENRQARERYELELAQFEERQLPLWHELREAINKALVLEQRVPTFTEIPEEFQNRSLRSMCDGPREPKPEKPNFAYYDTLLAFLAAVTDNYVTEHSMSRAGFHDIGEFFAEPGVRLGRRPVRRR